MRVLMCALALVVLPPSAAVGDELSGLTQMNFAFAPIEGDGRLCGLNIDAIIGAVKLPIRAYTKIREPAQWEFSLPAMSIEITTVRTTSGCVHHVLMDVYVATNAKLIYQTAPAYHRVRIWNTSGLLTGGAPYVHSKIEEMAKKFVNAWQSANP